jgi:hypothetical protein
MKRHISTLRRWRFPVNGLAGILRDEFGTVLELDATDLPPVLVLQAGQLA